MIFEGKASSLQDFKMYFLRMLYSWSQVLDGVSKMSLLESVDKIMQESLRDNVFWIYSFCIWVSHPWCLIYITILITYQKNLTLFRFTLRSSCSVKNGFICSFFVASRLFVLCF